MPFLLHDDDQRHSKIRLIWPSQLNLIKTLYFMNRLIPIAGAITICYGGCVYLS